MKTQVMKAPRADEKQRARAEMGGGWAGGGGKEGSREEFKRGNLRQPELINAEGEGGGGKGGGGRRGLREEGVATRPRCNPFGHGAPVQCFYVW